MAGLGPRVGVIEEHLGQGLVRQHIKKIAHIAGVQPQVLHACAPNLAQKHCDAVHERLGPEDRHAGVGSGHVDKMLAPAKADLQPQGALNKAKIERRPLGIILTRDAAQGQGAKILGEVILLAGAQGLAPDPAIEVAAGRRVLCRVRHGGISNQSTNGTRQGARVA